MLKQLRPCSALRAEDGSIMGDAHVSQLFGIASTGSGNNYSRPEGQNVGNFLGDRPSSRVLAAPGGKSNMSLAHDGTNTPVAAPVKPSFHGAQPATPVMAAAEPAAEPTPKGKNARFLDAMTAKITGHAAAVSKTPAPMPAAAEEQPPAPPAAAPPPTGPPTKQARLCHRGCHPTNEDFGPLKAPGFGFRCTRSVCAEGIRSK
jgi:protein SPIRAL1 and related proteins